MNWSAAPVHAILEPAHISTRHTHPDAITPDTKHLHSLEGAASSLSAGYHGPSAALGRPVAGFNQGFWLFSSFVCQAARPVLTVRVKAGNGSGCSQLLARFFPVHSEIEWLLHDVHVHFDCARLARVCPATFA